MIMHHVLIDFENIRPKVDALATLIDENVRITIFANAKQNLPVDMVKTLQPFGKRVEYIEMFGSGKNALDFFIAFQLGYILRENSEAKIYVISGDTGFDPLINYLTATCLKSVERLDNVVNVTKSPALPKNFSESLPSPPPGTLRQRVIDICLTLQNLPQKEWPYPATIAALKDFIKSVLGACNLSEQHIAGLLKFMAQKELISVCDDGERFLYYSDNIAVAAKGHFITKEPIKISQTNTEPASPVKEWMEKICDDLEKRGTSRPKTLNTLTSTIKALCKGELSAQHIETALDFMKKKKIIAVSDGTKVTYNLKNFKAA